MPTRKIKENNIELIYDYSIKSKDIFGFSIKSISMKILDHILSQEKVKTKCEVNLHIVDNKTIRSINKRERNINKATDVLSFPLIDYEVVKNIDKYIKSNKKYIDFYDYDKKIVMLGDIIISADKALAQSKKYNHSIKREFSFLFAHSVLHLLGYDHMVKSEEEIMFSKQDKYLNDLGIVR